MALSLLAAVITWRLWRANLHIPIFSTQGDAAWTVASVKGIMQHGWYESNSSLAAPFGQLNYDFPAYVGEFGKAIMVKALALIFSNPAVVVNLILLGGFPMIALTAFLVLRHLDFSRGVALVCAVLFATSPIHFFLAPRQAFIAIYAGIPLSAYLILAILAEKPLFRKRENDNRRIGTGWLSRCSIATIVMCLLIGCLGLNYAEFTCMLIGFSALLMFMLRRQVAVLGTAILVIVAITIPVLASAAPDLAYRANHGTNTVVAHRIPVETFKYGLQPVQLILPQLGDRVPLIGKLTTRIDSDLEQNYPGIPINLGPQISLGLVSALGLIWLLWVLIGGALGRQREDPLARQAGVAVLLTTLLATVGGGSVLFAYLVTATLQVWARISVLIGFFAVIGLALLLERGLAMLRDRANRSWLSPAMLAVVLVVGVFEGTTNRFVPNYKEFATVWQEETQFVAQIQHSLPANAMVLELPYVKYPEAELPTGLTSYEPLVPYVHSTALRWSAGAMEGRPTDWLASASSLPIDRLMRGAVAAGFDGVYVLRAGYADQGASVVASIQASTGITPLNGAAGTAAFFNLLPYAQRLKAATSVASIAAIGDATIHPPTLHYGKGFYEAEAAADEPRWGQQTDVLTINNPATVAQTVRYSTVLVTGYAEKAKVTVSWPGGTSTVLMTNSKGEQLTRSVVLPPGNTVIRFTTNAPKVVNSADPRTLYLAFRESSLTSAADM